MTRTVTLKELRPALPRVMNGIDRRMDRYVVTRHGRPVAMMLSVDDYESLIETLDIQADRRVMAGLKAAEAEARAGRTRPWNTIKAEIARTRR